MVRKIWDKLNTSYWLSLGIVLLGTFVTYFYSLFHMLRSEILVYFLHAGSNNSVISLIQNTMTRTTGASDTWLFRPLGSVILAIGKVTIGFDALGWHILSLVLFMIAVWCMFRLLWKVKPGIIAMLMALFFGTFYAAVNAVLYTQLVSYLIFIALTLAGLFYLYRGVEQGRNRDIYIAMSLMFVSCFLYEVGVVLIALSGVYIWMKHRMTRHSVIAVASAFGAFLAVYCVAKFAYFTPTQANEFLAITSPSSVLRGIGYIFYIPSYWIPMIMMPSAFSIFPVASLESQTAGIGSDFPIVWMLVNLAALVAIGIFAFPKKGEKANKAFALVLGVTAFVFVCLVAVYRGNDIHTGINYIIDTNITLNMFLAWTIPLAFIFLRPKKEHIKYVAVALLIMVCISASKTFTLNYQTWKMEKPYREYEVAVDRLVQDMKDEDGFSFATYDDGRVDYVEENLKFNWPEVSPDGSIKLVQANYFQVKYYQYWNPDNPEWLIGNGEIRRAGVKLLR